MKQALHRILGPLLWLVCLFSTPIAFACTAGITGGALGSVSTFRVQSGLPISGTGNISYSCSPVVLSALAGVPSLKATIQPSTTGLTLKNGSHSIPYTAYSNASMSTPYTGGLVALSINSTTLLGLLNGAGGQVPIYITTTPGANIPAGVYSDTLQVTWTYANICEGLVNVAGLCLGFLNNGTTTSSLVITLTVTNDCTITAPPVAFGSAPLVSGFPAVSQSISLLCSKNMAYTVGMSAGANSQGGRRQMASGGNRLAYDIFKANNTVWGHLNTDRENGPAVSDGVTIQSIPYTARIYQDQATPAAALYTDSVVVDVAF